MKEKAQQFINWTKLKIRIHFHDATHPIFFKEREIWWASLGVNVGYEQNGKNETFERPVLILKKFNLDLMWILPLTTQDKRGKYYYQTEYMGNKFNIILSQLRMLSSKRLRRKIRTLPQNEFKVIRKKVKDFI